MGKRKPVIFSPNRLPGVPPALSVVRGQRSVWAEGARGGRGGGGGAADGRRGGHPRALLAHTPQLSIQPHLQGAE